MLKQRENLFFNAKNIILVFLFSQTIAFHLKQSIDVFFVPRQKHGMNHYANKINFVLLVSFFSFYIPYIAYVKIKALYLCRKVKMQRTIVITMKAIRRRVNR